jgi:hypothetical protein
MPPATTARTCDATPLEVRVRAKALQEALMKAFVAERRAEIRAKLPSFAPYRIGGIGGSRSTSSSGSEASEASEASV